MHHWVDGDKNSDIAIVKVIAIVKIQTVAVVILKSVKLAKENQSVNGLDGNQLNHAVLPAVVVSNHVNEIAKKKCPIIFVIYQKILKTVVQELSKKNLHVKLVSSHIRLRSISDNFLLFSDFYLGYICHLHCIFR